MNAAGEARSLTDRIRNAADASGQDPQRLRRRVTFQRILSRLGAEPGWILKGGFCLEVRFGLLSRATKDLDLVAAHDWARDLDLQDALDEALTRADGDGFSFAVARPKAIAVAGRGAWRVPIEAHYAGRRFSQVRLDVVAQHDELEGAVETLRIAPPVAGLDIGDVEVTAVDVHQHAAEKIHAYARVYAEDRPSSRVKDLVDLVLLIESGVVDPRHLRERVLVVHQRRDAVDPPDDLPPPPASWVGDYEAMLAEHDLGPGAATLESAFALLTATYRAAMNDGEGPTA